MAIARSLPRRVDAMLVDLFGTLVTVDVARLPSLKLGGRTVSSALPAVLRELGAILPALPMEDALRAIASVRAERPRRGDHAEIPEHAPFAALLERLGVPDDDDQLARRLADSQMAAMVAACRPIPGAQALLAAVRARGVRTALVSNLAHAGSLPDLLSIADPGRHLDATVTSLEVGHCKPDARPFALALARLGVDAGRTVHVGDDVVDDVAGAARAAIHPIWFNPAGRAWPGAASSPPTTVTRLAQVERLLRDRGP